MKPTFINLIKYEYLLKHNLIERFSSYSDAMTHYKLHVCQKIIDDKTGEETVKKYTGEEELVSLDNGRMKALRILMPYMEFKKYVWLEGTFLKDLRVGKSNIDLTDDNIIGWVTSAFCGKHRSNSEGIFIKFRKSKLTGPKEDGLVEYLAYEPEFSDELCDDSERYDAPSGSVFAHKVINRTTISYGLCLKEDLKELFPIIEELPHSERLHYKPMKTEKNIEEARQQTAENEYPDITGYESDEEKLLLQIAKSLHMPYEPHDNDYDRWNYHSLMHDFHNGRGDEWVDIFEEENLDKNLLDKFKKLVNYKEEPLEEARQQTALKSNGIYSVMNHKWIKEPVAEDIPEFNEEAFNKLFSEWEDRYFKVIGEEPEEPRIKEELNFTLDDDELDELSAILLTEGTPMYGLFAEEIDASTGKKIKDWENGKMVECGTKQEMTKRAREYEDSWNVNSQGKTYKFKIRYVGNSTF